MYINILIPEHFIFLEYSVFTPYYSETVLYSSSELRVENEDGISTIFYLQKIFPGYFFCYLFIYLIIVFSFDFLPAEVLHTVAS